MLTNLINLEFEPRNDHFDLGLAADEVILVPLESHVQRIQVSKDVGKIAYLVPDIQFCKLRKTGISVKEMDDAIV